MKKEQADLLIRQVQVYNSYLKQFYLADVSVKDGKIFYVDDKGGDLVQAEHRVDGTGMYMIPGLIDIHMHIESSMMVPETFCRHMAACGVTTIVSEPHEIANVGGLKGVLDNISAGENCPIDVFYGIPSCVPSTSHLLETTGGEITCEDMEHLAENERVICVGEVMNYRQVIRDNDLEIGKFLKKLGREESGLVIEGHCPALTDLDLAKFLFLGINGDHTEHNREELMQRFRDGMYVEIQEKMLHPWVLDLIRDNHLEEHFGFVTDDVMADTLLEEGQLDGVIRKAIALGMKPEQAIYNGTFTNARRMKLCDRGVIAPGKRADFVLLSEVENLTVKATYKDGVCIYGGESKGSPLQTEASSLTRNNARKYFSEDYYTSVHLAPQPLHKFCVPADGEEVMVRVMEVCDGSTQTREKHVRLLVKDHEIQWEGSECALAMVMERYGKNQTVGYGFVCGDVIKTGAVATTYAHDSHNLLVLGRTAKDMQTAANQVIGMQGGMAVADAGTITASLQLNVGGIVSDAPIEEISRGLKNIRTALVEQGYHHYNPVMSLCTLSLPVSPALKLTNFGLVDVARGEIVELVVDEK